MYSILADLHVRKLIEHRSGTAIRNLSPDGKQIAFATFDNAPFFYYANRYTTSW